MEKYPIFLMDATQAWFLCEIKAHFAVKVPVQYSHKFTLWLKQKCLFLFSQKCEISQTFEYFKDFSR
jgi:hypothetical protein